MNVKKVGQMVFYVGLGVLVSGYFNAVYAVGSAPPSVTTTSATPSGTDGFVAGGNVTSPGDFPVTARGICWNTTGNPTIGDSKTTDGTGTGEFTSTVTGLSAGTTYYYRAYATNGEGTGYGSQMTVTTVSELPSVATTSATLNGTTGFDAGGNVTSQGGSAVTVRGVCWNTTGSPTISDNKTTDGTGTGAFTSNVTGLSENTLYYFRAYATNSGGTAYGETLTIITGSSTVTANYSLTPVTSLPTEGWRVVACSQDGSRIVAGKSSSSIYTSTDSGATWTERTGAGSRNWNALACSADGTKMVIANNPGSLFTSTDSGATWTERTGPGTCQAWTSAACSSDGTRMVAVPIMGSIFTSADSGETWTARHGSRRWHGVCSSSDGVHLAAVVENGYIYTSSDSGVTWTEQTESGSRKWYSIACSSDGKKLVAVVNGGQIYTSTDYGESWSTARDSNRDWYHVTSSADGTHLFASVNGGRLYWSNDSGVTWTAFESSLSWQGVSLSSDGTKLMACDSDGYLYVKATPTVTTTSATLTGTTSFSAGGNVISDNDSSVTARGICWNTTGSPTISDSKTTDGTGTGAFTSTVTGLTKGVTYYYCAYATNAYGTSYGKVNKILMILPHYTWAEVDPANGASLSWFWCAISADGTKMMIGANDDYLYLSSDSGTTWNKTLPGKYGAQNPTGLAMSQDGSTLIAGIGDGRLYLSKNFGEEWAEIQPDGNCDGVWRSAAISADNTKIVVVSYTPDDEKVAGVYRSGDSGETWTKLTPVAGDTLFESMAMSSDGTMILVGSDCDPLYLSKDSGTTWTEVKPMSDAAEHEWITVAMSSDGGMMLAGILVPSDDGASLYMSKNSGSTWTAIDAEGDNDLSCSGSAISSDGKILAAGFYGGLIYTSKNSGTNWLEAQPMGDADEFWPRLAMSADGSKLLAVYGDRVFIGTLAIYSTAITDDNGAATVGNDTVDATVSGFDPELPVSIEENENNDQVLTIGQASSPRFAATISGAAAGTTISASANSETQQNTIQLTQPGGRNIRIVLVQFPEGANVGLNLGNVQQIVGNVTNQDGQAMDVEIRAVDDGGDITFILTYHPPAGNANAKVIWFAPGGSVTIEADGVPANGVYSISLSYAGVSLGQTDVADLRMMRVNDDGSMTAAGTKDLGNVSATDALGDYGIDTGLGKVWSNVDTLGTFAVGVPKTPVEEITTVTTSYGCPIFGGLLLTLMCLSFVGLNETRKF